MEVDNKTKIAAKFSELLDKTESIFDPGYLKEKFNKEDLFEEKFNPFLDGLGSEIKSLPQDKLIFYHIEHWTMSLEERIRKAKNKEKLSETGRIFLSYRKKLRAKLSEIKSDLMNTEVAVKEEPKASAENPLSFKDIFTVTDWKKYINALHEVDNPVIDSNYKFIGNPKNIKVLFVPGLRNYNQKVK